jgi:DNA-binding response OmpR family regulator
MSKKTIVLADNSYTIRRIVELSFSDETDIELLTFENGLNLREKLLELRPKIVLVDIKLPEFNGYDVCDFVQGTEALKHTKVFLLKGGFEPIDEGLLKGLEYEDIITKPFDSNALVANIKKLLEKMSVPAPPGGAVELPSSLPEDEELPEIVTLPEHEKEINFSDIKEEIDSDEIMGDEDQLMQMPGNFADEEILPSEEITRAQPDPKDTISPSPDEDDNPFADESPAPTTSPGHQKEDTDSLMDEELDVKRNIELQEKELAIDSLTLEEINIKRDIERHERERLREQQQQEDELNEDEDEDDVIKDEGDGLETDTSDMFPESKLDTQEDFFALDEQKTGGKPPAFESGEGLFSKEELDEPEDAKIPEIRYEQELENQNGMEIDFQPGTFSTRKMEAPEEPRQEDLPQEEKFQYENETAEGMDPGFSDEEAIAPPSTREFEIPGIETSSEIPEVDVAAEEIPGMLEETELAKTPDAANIPGTYPQQFDMDMEEEVIPNLEKPKAAEVHKTPVTAPPPKPPTPPGGAQKKVETAISQGVILDKIEDKLSHAIKEMLWEIVPPLAEKIIKEEIENLKLETEKSLE